MCAWAVGEQGELRLGVLEPSGGAFVLRRRFSDRMTVPVGRVLRGELRPAGQLQSQQWEAAAEPEQLFSAAWLRPRAAWPIGCDDLHGKRHALSGTAL